MGDSSFFSSLSKTALMHKVYYEVLTKGFDYKPKQKVLVELRDLFLYHFYRYGESGVELPSVPWKELSSLPLVNPNPHLLFESAIEFYKIVDFNELCNENVFKGYFNKNFMKYHKKILTHYKVSSFEDNVKNYANFDLFLCHLNYKNSVNPIKDWESFFNLLREEDLDRVLGKIEIPKRAWKWVPKRLYNPLKERGIRVENELNKLDEFTTI